jgi:hypothetical protein
MSCLVTLMIRTGMGMIVTLLWQLVCYLNTDDSLRRRSRSGLPSRGAIRADITREWHRWSHSGSPQHDHGGGGLACVARVGLVMVVRTRRRQ